jgi:hypothetical protein
VSMANQSDTKTAHRIQALMRDTTIMPKRGTHGFLGGTGHLSGRQLLGGLTRLIRRMFKTVRKRRTAEISGGEQRGGSPAQASRGLDESFAGATGAEHRNVGCLAS